MDTILLPSSSPIVSVRMLFNSGSALDPAGKEGVAALTASLLSQGGSANLTYEEIVRAMYPMATKFESQTDKEMTVFTGQTHVDNLEAYYQVTSQMLLNPGWRQEDFNRVREDAINFLRINLRGNNDEELGKEHLYNSIYHGTVYGHVNAGTIKSLESLTLDDLKDFYSRNYTQARLVVGLAGQYTDQFLAKMKADFGGRLPAGDIATSEVPKPEKIEGLELEVIEKDARGCAISLGFPIEVTRADRDWPALLVAQSYLGQHRSSNSHLFQVMRQIRGMNYGDYAYIEYFPNGMFQFQPNPNLSRRHQIFQIWIRPVEPPNALFALRLGLFELRKLVEHGITAEDFEATRRFLSKFVNVQTGTQDAQLGYALDSHFYGIPEYNSYVRDRLAGLTLDDVNGAVRRYLQPNNVKVVVVTSGARGFVDAALKDTTSPITYTSPPSEEILREDQLVERYELGLNTNKVRIVPVEEVFEK